MELITKADIKMFYTLLSKYNTNSPYIAVIGNQIWFNIFTRTQITFYKVLYKKNKLKIIKNKNSCHIFIDDKELSYIKITTIDDLINTSKKFCKFI